MSSGNTPEQGQEQPGHELQQGPGSAPRVTALPGPSRLVRISEESFALVRAIALEEEPAQELTEAQALELERAGLLTESQIGRASCRARVRVAGSAAAG